MLRDTFDWDPVKASANLRKHGVDFDEASTVFADENAPRFYDFEHSEEEDRFILLGFSQKQRLLVVCYCYREEERIIRIISARKATRNESRQYGS